MRYEYKVVPAPEKGEKARGLKTGAARFAHVLSRVMNEEAAEGWEFLRSETLPCNERKGLTGSVKVYHTLLVFRRAQPGQEAAAPAAHPAAPLRSLPPVAPVAAAIPVEPPRPVSAPTPGPRLSAPVPSFMRRMTSATEAGTPQAADPAPPAIPAPQSDTTPR